jgi:hypothetical protein
MCGLIIALPYSRLISEYVREVLRATLVRCAARETSRATAGDTFRLKTDGIT